MDQRIKYAIGIMEKNRGVRLRLDQVAGALHLSPSRFRHLFKKEIGQDYRSYLRELRLAKAKDLLGNLSLSIKQIADQAGYPHARNFARIFKKRFGKTPSRYRQETPQTIGRLNSLLGD